MLKKSTLREIKTSLSRYLAIFAIVALGVGFFSGLKDCKASMVSTATRYLGDSNMHDFQLLSSYGVDEDSLSLAKSWDGIQDAEASIEIDVMASSGGGSSKALKAISIPENINKLRVVTGRLPQNPEECVVDDYSITEDAYRIGDKIVLTNENEQDKLDEFKHREFTIVGTVNTPIYLDYQRGSTDIGNGSLDSFFFIEEEAFNTDYYTSLYVILDHEIIAPFTSQYDDMLDSSLSSMDDLAEKMTEKRRESVMEEAQEKLDEKRQEYEDGLAKYRAQKAKTEKKLKAARKELKNGYQTIENKKAEAEKAQGTINNTIYSLEDTIEDLKSRINQAKKGIETINATIAELETQKSAIETGIAEVEAVKLQIEQGYAAELITQEQYEAGINEVTATITELNAKLAKVNDGIAIAGEKLFEAESGLAQAEQGLEAAKDGLNKAKDGRKEAEQGLATIEDKKREADKSAKTLKNAEAKADREFAKARRELEDAKDKLDEAQEEIADLEVGNSYALSRNENFGYSSFDSNSDIVNNIAKVFPVFFFLIAALVCMTTMTRMIDEQRTQIGVLKALGYSSKAIAAKYMFYSGSGAFMGAIAGFFIGCKVFPAVIWNAYTMMYDFSETCDYIIDWKLGLVSLIAAMICSMGATWVALAGDFKVAPAELIRPKTPPAGRRILLERWTGLWNRISFLYKVSIRNIFRDRKRFLMMVIGVSGCTALLVAGMGINTTIAKVADHQFEEVSIYDFQTIFTKKMTPNRQDEFLRYMEEEAGVTPDEVKFVHQAEVTLVMPDQNFNVLCTAATPEEFGRFISLRTKGERLNFPDKHEAIVGDSGNEAQKKMLGEVVVDEKIQHDFGIQVGDVVTLRDDYREMQAVVSGISDNYVNENIYMSVESYEAGFGKEAQLKTALVRLNSDTDSEPNAETESIEDDSASQLGAEPESESEHNNNNSNNITTEASVTQDSTEQNSDDKPVATSDKEENSIHDSSAARASEGRIRAVATAAVNYELTAAVSNNLDVRENVGQMMKSLDAVIFVVILSAALLAFIVLYNLTNINITERIREIATIKVLGFNQLEVSQYVFRENMFMTAVAAIVGIPLGNWLLGFVIDCLVVSMIYFVPRITIMNYVLAVVLTFLFAFGVNFAMQRRLRSVSMTESLKSVE